MKTSLPSAILFAIALDLSAAEPKSDAPVISIQGSPLETIFVSEDRPKKINPAKLKEKIYEGMTLGELVMILGPGWMSQYEGVGYSRWFFDDDTSLEILLRSREPSTLLTFKQPTQSMMSWRK